MRTATIRVGSPYRTVPVDAQQLSQSHVAHAPVYHARNCQIPYGGLSSAYSSNQEVTLIALCGASSYRPSSVNALGFRRLAKGRDVVNFNGRFGDLNGSSCQTSAGFSSESNCNLRDSICARAASNAGANGGENSRSESDEPVSSSVWDLHARHKRVQAAAAKVGDPFRDMMTNASKKLQDYLDNIKHSKSREKAGDQKPESDWERWQKVFADAEEREGLASVLQFQLEEAIQKENFQDALVLKEALSSVNANDLVSEVLDNLKSALKEERYNDAALLRDNAGAGLVGWWAGLGDGGNDPYGRIIHVIPAQGRFLAKSYSARQLATGATGIPLFEIFLAKEKQEYQKQAVYLQRDGNVTADTFIGSMKQVDARSLDAAVGKEESKTKDLTGSSDTRDGNSKDTDIIDDGINSILSFLKERMPDVKLKVVQVTAPEGMEADLPELVEQLLDAEKNENSNRDIDATLSANGDKSGYSSTGQDKAPVGSGSSTNSVEGANSPIRLVVGGVLQSNVDEKVPRVPVRVPARIEQKSKNSFVFHIEDSSLPKESVPSWKVATIASKASAELMPDDVAKVLWNVEKVPLKVSKEMGEIIRLAVSQAQRRRGLFKSTTFNRINISQAGGDPLDGLYIGAFGPYTSEVVQLQRKYGQWEEEEASSSGGQLEFFEYVEAVKLTGDLNVPAGQTTFRAKIGKGRRLSTRGAYPEDFGVVSRYKGQGRLAEPGFRNPQWIDGELVLLDGKGGGLTNGAELGFVYLVPERHCVVLFNRLRLG